VEMTLLRQCQIQNANKLMRVWQVVQHLAGA
jgi:hypothetical protein